MKKRHRIGEQTDQELAEQQEEEPVIVIYIAKTDWYLVYQDQGWRMVLTLAENGRAPAVLRYLEILCERELGYCRS